ncbi:exodeoxyribonuclease VII large subunit [Phaeodactylibacter luteus]|uniref:exodeoxyribonuclease VII large subunit n=1 Tax=Phaeodactylibacter luteus TaxID=1564516 RepID=UPI00147979A0|nr:exodeoxyribonuclease VII large subunit [Phaeodactylibacter luteus]
MEKHSLFELNRYLRRAIALNLPNGVWVSCEINQLGQSRGHYYLTLVEKEAEGEAIIAQAEAVLWSRQHKKLQRQLGRELQLVLREGTQVLLKVQADFHERYGLKYIIEEVDLSYTIGQLELQRRAVREQLEKEGLLYLNKQLKLPTAVQRLAIVSAATAAGYADFMQQLSQNEYGYRFSARLYNAAVQGQYAADEIARQLKAIEQAARPFDAVALVRGGGARLDLAAFDEYKVCKAIAQCPFPVITGVGHETDEPLVELVAHTPLKTPTAAAAFLIDRNLQFEAHLLELGQGLQRRAMSTLREANLGLEQHAQAIALLARQGVDRQQQAVGFLSAQFPAALNRQLQQQSTRLGQLEQLFELLSPEATLRRGYTLTLRNGAPVRKASQLKSGDSITTRFIDGEQKSTVE